MFCIGFVQVCSRELFGKIKFCSVYKNTTHSKAKIKKILLCCLTKDFTLKNVQVITLGFSKMTHDGFALTLGSNSIKIFQLSGTKL